MTSRIKTTRGARCTAGGFRGCWSSADAQNHGGGVSFVSWSRYKRDYFTGKVVDKNTREALTCWISCRGLTTAVESFDTCTKVTNYDKHWYRTTLWFREFSAETTCLKGCLLNDIIKRLLRIKYPMCQRSQINLLFQSQFRNNSSSNCCKPDIRTGTNRSMLPTASNCIGRPSNFLAALEAASCQFQQSTPSNRKYTTFIRIDT